MRTVYTAMTRSPLTREKSCVFSAPGLWAGKAPTGVMFHCMFQGREAGRRGAFQEHDAAGADSESKSRG